MPLYLSHETPISINTRGQSAELPSPREAGFYRGTAQPASIRLPHLREYRTEMPVRAESTVMLRAQTAVSMYIHLWGIHLTGRGYPRKTRA